MAAEAWPEGFAEGAGDKTPTEKNFKPEWIQTLGDRSDSIVYTKDNSADFSYIGMPVGGIGAGELYLSGDGRLWDWDVFGSHVSAGFPVEGGLAYIHPHTARDPYDSQQEVVDQMIFVLAAAHDVRLAIPADPPGTYTEEDDRMDRQWN